MKKIALGILLAIVASVSSPPEAASETGEIYPVAILTFAERGSGVKDYGQKVTDILFASLADNPQLYLVDRHELAILLEHELNLSGMVKPSEAVQIGQLTGAKILVTGSVLEADKDLYLVAKIIGTETSRVLGTSVKGLTRDELAPLVETLAEKVTGMISKQAQSLVAKRVQQKDRLAALAGVLGEAQRPTVSIKIREHHVGQPAVDPAAETEMTLFCRKTGFEVIDHEAGSAKLADILIQGEGFSEFAMRRGNLLSVKARLEVKAIDQRTSKVIASDRQSTIAVDLSERIAGKKALEEAAAAIAERILPELVKPR